jgi:hypothetical protein
MVTNSIPKRAKTAKKPAASTTTGELAAVGSLGANIITTPRRKPNYRAPASVGTSTDLAIESDARAPDTDRDPPTLELEEEPPPPQSALAVRLIDGAIFVSVQDAPADVDLRGREVLAFMRLNDDEILLARASFDESHADIVANIIGRLPGRST